MRKMVIFGATSAIAFATARKFAEKNAQFFLVARNAEKLESVKNDLLTRGANKVSVHVADLGLSENHAELFSELESKMSDYDTALIAYGSLSDQRDCELDFEAVHKELDVNFISVVSILTKLANNLSAKKEGTIAVISSVAGDRGRQSNYIYGAAKGALTVLLQGLRNRLCVDGVNVLTIKPGFVDTPMTADIDKNFLFVKPEAVAIAISNAIDKKKDVIYVPWFWRYIMLIIKLIPEFVFKRLKL